MKSLKDIIGPVRTNKAERKQAQSRERKRIQKKTKMQMKFGPDKSLLHQFRKGSISQSSIRKVPLKPYKPIVKDQINPFGKNKDFLKSGGKKKSLFDDEFFRQ